MSLRYDTSFYAKALDNYITTGSCEQTSDEPLYAYLLSVMNDPSIKIQVLTNEICAKIFYDMMSQFVRLNLQKATYNLQKSQSQQLGMELVLEWTDAKKKDGWQALLQEVSEEYTGYGFDSVFYQREFGEKGQYVNKESWEKMVNDWKEAYNKKLHHQKEEEISQRKEDFERRVQANLSNIPSYINSNNIDKDEFYQSWGLMGGMWNTIDFERIRKIVRIQREYPQIVKVANKMGRIADDNGDGQLFVSQGDLYKLEHSFKSDIQGITVGNDLNALLPIELAHYVDEELEDLFMYKYVTRKLQTFKFKSEIMKPNRSLQVKPAVKKGPMIVCLDTSGSMVGRPEKISHSLLIKVLEIADKQKRDCFLIAFSVSIHPIDTRKERARLLEFFATTSCGDTNATKMLQETFQLLQSKKEYMNADVLWVSDFKIPLTSPELRNKILSYKGSGTHFYGFQLGVSENEWAPYFDDIFQVDYTPSRRF